MEATQRRTHRSDEEFVEAVHRWPTTLVVVEIDVDGTAGLGYSYADAAAAEIIDGHLASRRSA
jgi:hypothetical protein